MADSFQSGIFRSGTETADSVDYRGERETFAGIEHGVVDGFAGQTQILVAVIVIVSAGLVFAQGVLEKCVIVENFGRDVFHGNSQHFAILGFFHKLFRCFQIKAVTVGTGLGFEILEVDRGVYRLDVKFFVDGLQIDGIRIGDGGYIFHFHQELMEAVGIQNLFIDGICVKTDAGGTHNDYQRLGGSVCVESVSGQYRLIALQTVTGLCQRAAGVLGVGKQFITDVIQIQLQVGQRGNDMLFFQGVLICLFLLCLVSGAAIFKGGIHSSLYIQPCFRFLGGKPDFRTGQVDDHVLLGIGILGCGSQRGDCFAFGHAADVDIRDQNIGENNIRIGIFFFTGEENGNKENDQQQSDAAQTQNNGGLMLADGVTQLDQLVDEIRLFFRIGLFFRIRFCKRFFFLCRPIAVKVAVHIFRQQIIGRLFVHNRRRGQNSGIAGRRLLHRRGLQGLHGLCGLHGLIQHRGSGKRFLGGLLLSRLLVSDLLDGFLDIFFYSIYFLLATVFVFR